MTIDKTVAFNRPQEGPGTSGSLQGEERSLFDLTTSPQMVSPIERWGKNDTLQKK